jgi:hypothetical protein
LVAYLKVKAGLALTEGEKKVLGSLDPDVQQKIGFQS